MYAHFTKTAKGGFLHITSTIDPSTWKETFYVTGIRAARKIAKELGAIFLNH